MRGPLLSICEILRRRKMSQWDVAARCVRRSIGSRIPQVLKPVSGKRA